MTKDEFRSLCLSFPHATEQVQWGYDLLYKIGGKMFAVTNLEPAEITGISIKCTPEKFAELVEREGIDPAPYLARHMWVHIKRLASLKPKELRELVRASYDMVYEKLPPKIKRELG